MKLEMHANVAIVLSLLFGMATTYLVVMQITTCRIESQACTQACIEQGKEPDVCKRACSSRPEKSGYPDSVNTCIKDCINATKQPAECEEACTKDMEREMGP